MFKCISVDLRLLCDGLKNRIDMMCATDKACLFKTANNKLLDEYIYYKVIYSLKL